MRWTELCILSHSGCWSLMNSNSALTDVFNIDPLALNMKVSLAPIHSHPMASIQKFVSVDPLFIFSLTLLRLLVMPPLLHSSGVHLTNT